MALRTGAPSALSGIDFGRIGPRYLLVGAVVHFIPVAKWDLGDQLRQAIIQLCPLLACLIQVNVGNRNQDRNA